MTPFPPISDPGGSAPPGEDPTLTQLSQLGTLHADGTLTDDEFAREKNRVLTDRPRPPSAAT